jgi:hypothetical protein
LPGSAESPAQVLKQFGSSARRAAAALPLRGSRRRDFRLASLRNIFRIILKMFHAKHFGKAWGKNLTSLKQGPLHER